MRAHLDGVMFYGDATPDVTFTLDHEALDGLFGGAGVRDMSVARPVAHGSFRLPQYRDVKVLPLTGLVLTDSLFAQQQEMGRLAGLLADGRSGVLTLDTEVGSRWCTVMLADAPDVSIVVPGTVAKYQLLLRADDPRLYGERRQFSGTSVSVHHMGNFPASPVIEVDGPRAAYTVTGPGGKQFQVSTALPAGQTDRIDLRTGKLTRNGSVAVGVVGRADVWTIPPGKQSTMSISVGSMTVNVTDTYM